MKKIATITTSFLVSYLKQPSSFNIKNYGYLLFFILSFLTLYSSGFCNTNTTTIIKDHSIFFSENPINIDPPLLKKSNTLFIPIRALLPYINAALSYDRKNNQYHLSLDAQTTISFKENHTIYLHNQTQNKLKDAPFISYTRLYLPLKETLAIMGYTQKNVGQNIYIVKTKPTTPTTPPPAIPNTSTLTSPLVKTQPQIPEGESISIYYKNKTIPINNYIYKNTILFIDLIPFFSELGYKVFYLKDQSVVIEKQKVKYIFSPHTSQIQIQKGNNNVEKTLPFIPLLNNNNNQLFHYNIIHEFGLFSKFNSTENKLYLLNQITNFEISKTASSIKLALKTTHPISISQKTTLQNPLRYYWDLRNTHFLDTQITRTISHPLINQIKIGNHPNKTRIVIYPTTKIKTDLVLNKTNIIFTIVGTAAHATQKIDRLSKPNNIITTPQPFASLKNKRIAIEAGHGGSDPGAIARDNQYEKNYTIDIANKLSDILRKNGAKVIMLREKDKNPTLQQRCDVANKEKADILISIHINSFIKPYANGLETFYYKQNDKKLSMIIHKHLQNTSGLANKGIKKAQMYILNHTTMPGVLIEPGFLTNPSDYNKIKKQAYRKKLATAISNGISEYFAHY